MGVGLFHTHTFARDSVTTELPVTPDIDSSPMVTSRQSKAASYRLIVPPKNEESLCEESETILTSMRETIVSETIRHDSNVTKGDRYKWLTKLRQL